jgi:hypothetical protein
MQDLDKLFGRAGRRRPIAPTLSPDDQDRLVNALKLFGGAESNFADGLRKLARQWVDDGDSLELRAISLLVADLVEQGWSIRPAIDHFIFEPPSLLRTGDQSNDEVKQRVQKALQSHRDRQLQEPSVRDFLRRMERPAKRVDGRRSSILDLIDDGRDLAQHLGAALALPEDRRLRALRRVIDPIVEVCEAGERCADTGLLLTDVWRYFRHTWSLEYRSIPGRQMMVLVRNAARPNRPIMGIAMLASPVMRLSSRDNWIGWTVSAAERLLASGSWRPRDFMAAVTTRLEKSISEVRWDDLATEAEINQPTENAVFRLQQRAYGAAREREAALKEAFKKGTAATRVQTTRSGKTDWREASNDLLFVRKRAEILGELLHAKLAFSELNLRRPSRAALLGMIQSKGGQKAVEIALAEFRKSGLASRVADVSVCGAVHPYSELLGGKLVALLLTSKEVRDGYAARYGGQVSIIASQMAGRAVVRPADLQILTTTSLYGLSSSQYNRLKIVGGRFKGIPFDIAWQKIATSSGYGTMHLGPETLQALKQMAERRHDARRINNLFGEGTSPRLRQIREGLDALGIASDSILHPATPRIFYGCELEPNARADLLSNRKRRSRAPSSMKSIGAAWRARWLLPRISNPDVQILLRIADQGVQSIRRVLHPNEELDNSEQLSLFEDTAERH